MQEYHSIKGSDFFTLFAKHHVILFLGSATTLTEVDLIADYPWSAVLTTLNNKDSVSIRNRFIKSGQRECTEWFQVENIKKKPLNREKLPFLWLCGDNCEEKSSDDEIDFGGPQDIETKRLHNAELMLRVLPALADHVNFIVFVGIQSVFDGKLIGSSLGKMLQHEIADETVFFWGMKNLPKQKPFEALRMLSQLKRFPWIEQSLGEYVVSEKEDTEPVTAISNETDSIYYSGGKICSVSSSDLIRIRNIGLLLTEQEITRITPVGHRQQEEWYHNFLEMTLTVGPQWYGYASTPTFHVKRSFEDTLTQLVRLRLKGKSPLNKDDKTETYDNSPIILSGPPSSSKSITLGALAYRIFRERIHPVLFIHEENFVGLNAGVSINELNDILQIFEKDERVLIIWDSSSYNTVEQNVRRITKQLTDIGRRFVFVCSSYQLLEDQNAQQIDTLYFDLPDPETMKFTRCSEQQSKLRYRSGCFIVDAVRNMNALEIDAFWERADRYAQLSKNIIHRLKKRLAERDDPDFCGADIFYHYHQLVTYLRSQLEKSLNREQDIVSSYVNDDFRKTLLEIADEKLHRQINPLLMNRSDENSRADSKPEEDALLKYQNLETFNICVAMFSRFKLEIPYGLVYQIMFGDSDEKYSNNYLKIYNIFTSRIPWIIYCESRRSGSWYSGRDFVFRYRNSYEAELFLRGISGIAQKEIDLLCRIIQIYGEQFQANGYEDPLFSEMLIGLLRLMGPNSLYTEFHSATPALKPEHKQILMEFDTVITSVSNLFDEYDIDDSDYQFTCLLETFIREYYGSLWDKLFGVKSNEKPWVATEFRFSPQDYESRIQNLVYAIKLAQHSVEQLENSQMTPLQIQQRNQLYVEMVLCNHELQRIIPEYKECCGYYKQPLISTCNISAPLTYNTIQRYLRKIIMCDPTDGYAYNALFKAFEQEYELHKISDGISETQLRLISTIQPIVEMCESMDALIVNRGARGMNELSTHLLKIHNYLVNVSISVKSVQQMMFNGPCSTEDKRFYRIFSELLQMNDPSGITFVCYNEMQKNRIPHEYRQLTKAELSVCQRIYDFMTDVTEINGTCIKNCVMDNHLSLQLLIRIAWMLFNKMPLLHAPECKLTKLNKEQWQIIEKYCEKYDGVCGDIKKNKDVKQQPILLLLYALAKIQVHNREPIGFQKATEILSKISATQFYLDQRTWTPYMICDENGEPVQYSGTVQKVKDNMNGNIRLDSFPRSLGRENGVRFRKWNIGKKNMPEVNDTLTQLELGIGYSSFSLYTETGRHKKEEQK